MNKIIIWGIGGRTEYYLKHNHFKGNQIVGYVDSDHEKKEFHGTKVFSPDELLDVMDDIDFIVISSKYYLDILKECIKRKLDWEKIVITDNDGTPLYSDAYERLKYVSQSIYDDIKECKYIRTKRNEYDMIDRNLRVGTGIFSDKEYVDEYFRFRTFELAAKELIRKDIGGAVAEFGVFRGVFSALINATFCDRKIYLFDTFEGFREEEANKELELGRCGDNFLISHKNTNIDLVKAAMPFPDKVVICQGYFPESIPETAYEELFAFVSLDVDFEESTYQGLKFFYPRLNNGGMIFVHDYNTYYLDGVKVAISRYEEEEKISLKTVPIADRAGTLVIVK